MAEPLIYQLDGITGDCFESEAIPDTSTEQLLRQALCVAKIRFDGCPGTYTKEDYQDLLKFLDREYDSGYGGQKLFGVIYCEDGVWMQRGEYDGSEWWNTFKYPSLRESFDEVDVIKYERSTKLKRIEENF